MAAETALQIVQRVCSRIGLLEPNTVSGATDLQAKQLFALLNAAGEDLAVRHQWNDLEREKTFTSVAAEDQGLLIGGILAIADGFKYIINDTLWDRTRQYMPAGSVTAPRWQLDKASVITGAFSVYRIRQGRLLMTPAPAAGHTIVFEYVTEHWAQDSGGVGKANFTADDDVPRLDSTLLKAELIWRWKAAKGFEYGEDHNKAEILIADAMARDKPGVKAKLDNEPDFGDFEPYVVVPRSSWNIP